MQPTSIPIIGSLLNFLDENIEKYGLQKGMLNLAIRSGTKLKISGLTPQLEKILKTERVVVVANHPHEAETIALIAAMPERKDFYMIVNHVAKFISQSLNKYYIPVYINHHTDTRKRRTPYGFLIKKFYPLPSYSAIEEHKKILKVFLLLVKK